MARSPGTSPNSGVVQRKSDGILLKELLGILERNPEIDLTDVALAASRGVITLTGTVEERRMMNAIERVILGKPGVERVDNQLRIRRADDYKTFEEIEEERRERIPKNLDDSLTAPPNA